MSEHHDMNGIWSGRYFYKYSETAVSFTAWFDDANGVLTGSTLEANTFAPGAPDELAADLTGLRHGSEIEFSKLYSSSTGIVQPPLMYLGTVTLSPPAIGASPAPPTTVATSNSPASPPAQRWVLSAR